MLSIHRAKWMPFVYARLRHWMELLYIFKKMKMKENTAWQEGFHVCMLIHVMVMCKCYQFAVKLVKRTVCARAGFEMHVGIFTTCPGICLLTLSLSANGEFPSSSLPTHRPRSQQHCHSESTLRKRVGFFFFYSFFGGALGVWAGCCYTLVWLNEVPSAVSLFET